MSRMLQSQGASLQTQVAALERTNSELEARLTEIPRLRQQITSARTQAASIAHAMGGGEVGENLLAVLGEAERCALAKTRALEDRVKHYEEQVASLQIGSRDTSAEFGALQEKFLALQYKHQYLVAYDRNPSGTPI